MSTEADEDRIWRLFDGDITPEEFAALERRLGECPETRARFLEHVDMHNLLGQKFSTPDSVARSMKGLASVDLVLSRQRRRAVRYSLLGAAAVLALLGVVLKIIFVPDPAPLVTFRTSEDTLLNVSHLAAAGKDPAPGTLAKGSRLVLRQGAAELTLASGVTAIVEAPRISPCMRKT